MDFISAEKRIEKLKKEIDFHRYNYHVLDKETLSPAALDDLKAELFRLENEFPKLITPDSPTQRVAGEVSEKFKKTNHSLPMISLFDAFSESDMLAWQERNENYLKRKLANSYYCELKLDGLAINIRYEKGLFNLAATRGDGKVGENVSVNVRAISSVPLSLRVPDKDELLKIGLKEAEADNLLKIIKEGQIELRGEAIMTKKVFTELNKKYAQNGKALLANTRNGVAGSIRQLDPRISAERKIDFYAYDLILSDLKGDILPRGEIVKSREMADKLAALIGFKTLKYNQLALDLKEVFSFYKNIEKKRDSLPFEIDGVVVKFDDLKMWDVLGIVGKAPRYMMAYKFSAEQATTKILDIVWQVGRTGALTPTAVLEPVRVGGALISRSTLHNFDEIKRLDLMIGDTIVIERSGDVIPKVIKVLKNLRSGEEKNIKAPKICPICEGEIEKIGDEVAYRCLNKKCYAVNLRKIIHFVSKNAVDMEGLGPKVIEQFLEIGLIKDPADLYVLKKPDLLSLERFAEKKADNILKVIEERKKIDLARFIFALGIRHVGEETAEMLAGKIFEKNKEVSISKIIEYFKNLDEEALANFPDVGPVVSRSLSDYFKDEHNLEYLHKLESRGLEILSEKKLDSAKLKHPLFGKNFILTGSLSSLTRGEAKDRIKAVGARVKDSISKEIDFLVVGEEPGSKLEKAKKLGLKIINEKEFLDLLK